MQLLENRKNLYKKSLKFFSFLLKKWIHSISKQNSESIFTEILIMRNIWWTQNYSDIIAVNDHLRNILINLY